MKVEIVNAIRNRFRIRDDDAVSPVIGTIMMVAVTVVLAATVVAVMNGFGGDSTKAPSNAAFRVQSIDTNGNGATDTIKITYITGPVGVAAGDIKVTVTPADTTDTVTCTAPGTTWSPGDFITCTSDDAGALFVSVRMYENALVDQSVTLAE